MAKLNLKSFPQLVGAMAAKLAAETPITDFTDGSVALTLIELAAQEDFQAYVQMLNIIRNYNLDTTEGSDLDNRAAEYGLTRLQAQPHTGFVTISDSTFTKISTKVYAGLPGPTAGSVVIFVDDASTFPGTGSIYFRGSTNSEGPISYSVAPINHTSYWEIQLDTALVNDHGTDESIVLAQGGTRVIEAGTEVEIPESDVSAAVKFELNQTIQILDGENSFSDILVTAIEANGNRVPANSIISFPNLPFTGATVTNPLPFVNGRDLETDQQLRDRIRSTIQSLSRGTAQSVKSGILGLIDDSTNSSITSANVIPPVTSADGPTKVYIDNGRGLEPSFAGVGLETLVTEATGGEQFFQLQNFPLVKSSVTSQNVEPFSLSGTETLIVRVGTDEETFTFVSSDFETSGKALATEISEAINHRSTLFEARTITDSSGHKVILTPKATTNEEMQVDPASTSQSALNFSELEVQTLKVYKNDKLLTKDGVTASVDSLAQPFNLAATVFTTTDGDITVTPGSKVVTKAVSGSNGFLHTISPGDYVKFSTDSDTFYRKVKVLVSDTKLILDEAYPLSAGGTGNIRVWYSPQLEVASNGDIYETEIISFGPNDFANASQALASEVYSRVSAELNLSTVELAVNSTKIKLISNLKDSISSKMQVVGGGAALAMGFCTSYSLTGTLTVQADGVTVTGSSTQFTQDLQEGQWIKMNADGTAAWTKVEAIESDTVLYLAQGYRGPSSSGAASAISFGALAQGKDKDYTLNRANGQIELTTPLSSGDSLTAGSINTRAFVDSIPATFDFTGLGSSSTLIVSVDGGFPGTVTTGDAVAPYDTWIDTSFIGYEANLFNGFYVEWVSGLNVGETSFVSSYNTSTGQLSATSSFTNPISPGDKFVLSQVLTFVHATAFADPAHASASEVAAAINSQILGGLAEVTLLNKVRVKTANFDSSGKIQVKGGTANGVLAFSTSEFDNQLNNVAFVDSRNNDRTGNPAEIGFTLGPSQTLVAIFDGDSLNKTFSIPMEVKGTVTSASLSSFSDTSIGGKYLTSGYFNDFWIYWTGGSNLGSVQLVTGYTPVSGTFTYSSVFPTGGLANPISSGDTYSLVPRTAENVAKHLNDLNSTTMSVVSESVVIGITGDVVQVATKTPGSSGKVFITGGAANSIGIAISSVPGGSPVNDLQLNSKSGLAQGLYVQLSVDGVVTTGDSVIPYDSFTDTSMISSIPNYFTGMVIEFLTGTNAGLKTTIASYNNVTGAITLSSPASTTIDIGDTYRISTAGYITSLSGTSAPYTIQISDQSGSPVDVSEFTPGRKGVIRDVNGLNFESTQVEGVDGYKYFTGLIQKAQWTIDGLDRDITNYPGIGAAGTQFEVLTPVLVRLKLIVNITTNEGVSLSSVSDQIRTAIEEYVDALEVGADVILSEIVAAAQSVSGVFDVSISNHTANIVIADGELARLADSDLIIG